MIDKNIQFSKRRRYIFAQLNKLIRKYKNLAMNN